MLIKDIQNLTQLKPGQYATCFGIITDYSNPKSSRSKDFYQIVSLLDPCSNFKVTKLLIFHPDYNSFPNIQEIGEIILCRNVKVELHNEKIQIISNITSMFKVYPKIKSKNKYDYEEPIVDEYREWWRQNEINITNNFNFKKSLYKLNISQIKKDSKYFDIYGQLIRILYSSSNYTTALITDYTENELLEEKIFHEDAEIHAKIYLQCIFWDEYSMEITKFTEGDYLLIRNLSVKFNNNTIEGVIHGSNNKFGNSLFVLEQNDPNIEIIKKNKEIFLRNHMNISSSPPSPQINKTINDHNNTSIDDSLLISEGLRNLINPSEFKTSTPKKNIKTNENLFISSPIKNIQNDNHNTNDTNNTNNTNNLDNSNNINNDINSNNANNTNNNDDNNSHSFNQTFIRPLKVTHIEHFNMPITNIKTILNSKNIPNKYRCRVRVVDYIPRKIVNFTRPYCTVCKKTFEKPMDNSLVCCNRCKSTGDKIKYAFLFSLLVEDNSKCFLPIIIFEIDKSEFLGLPATDLKNPKEFEELKSRLKKLWEFKTISNNYCVNENKKLTLTHSRTVLCGNIFDVCIERYKNTQGIRQKVFDTRII